MTHRHEREYLYKSDLLLTQPLELWSASNFGKDSKMTAVVPKVSREVLAARVGTTRGRIKLFMNKFGKFGLIEYNGELRVHSTLLNVIVHD